MNNKNENNNKRLFILLVLLLFCSLILRTQLTDHSLPSNYTDDIELKHKGIELWDQFKSETPRQNFIKEHIYSLFGFELVAGWIEFNQKFFNNSLPINREQLTIMCRQLMMFLGFLFIGASYFLHTQKRERLICALIATTLLLPFMFFLMTRPHAMNLTFVTISLAIGYHLWLKPSRLKLLALGLFSGLSISIIFTSLMLLWLSFLIIRDKKLWRWWIWYLSGLILGLIPGHIDFILLFLHSDWDRVITPSRSYVDWTYSFKAREFSPVGFITMIKTCLFYDPILIAGCLFYFIFKIKDRFSQLCWWTLIPCILVLGTQSVNFPRFWLLTYPLVLIISTYGWSQLTLNYSKGIMFFCFFIGLSFVLQLRTAWLISHDTRPIAERQLMQMIPEESLVIYEPYTVQFNNYPAQWKTFKHFKAKMINPSLVQNLNRENIFYVTDQKNESSIFKSNFTQHASLVHSWEYPGSPQHTHHLPNKMWLPWISAWSRSVAGPNLYVYLINDETIPWK